MRWCVPENAPIASKCDAQHPSVGSADSIHRFHQLYKLPRLGLIRQEYISSTRKNTNIFGVDYVAQYEQVFKPVPPQCLRNFNTQQKFEFVNYLIAFCYLSLALLFYFICTRVFHYLYCIQSCKLNGNALRVRLVSSYHANQLSKLL